MSPFTDFTDDNGFMMKRLASALQEPLPGWHAHNAMINYPRPMIGEWESAIPDARQGAVLALIYPKNSTLHLVLTLRHSYKGHHSAQVSFPGGSLEAGDASHWYAALREAEEEIGLQKQDVQLLGTLSKVYIPPSNFLVHPFVAYCPHTPSFTAEPAEVARIIETPLSHILHPDTLKQKPMYLKVTQSDVNVRYFDIDGETVWGATAMMLNELKTVLLRIF